MIKQRLFHRVSEKYASTGNISAQGIQKLLGAPSLDQLQTVIREAVQNSCDAGVEGKQTVFMTSIRKLSAKQRRVLQELVLVDPLDRKNKDSIENTFSCEKISVLELADFGTKGLGGPTDASQATDEGDVTDFVDFVLNVGSPRDTVHGGGTYGYGKSSLYSLSRCKTVLIDSLSLWEGNETRRLLGARVGSSFTIGSGKNIGKYTGRHWWGSSATRAGQVEPLTGKDAAAVASALGFPARGRGDLGTTIMILDPAPLSNDDPEDILTAIQRSLLWNFWPKMVRYSGSPPSVEFRTMLDGELREIPPPESCPPLDLFSEAIQELKRGNFNEIKCQRPRATLGKLNIVKQQRGDRLQGFGPSDDGMFPERCSHVALMRPVELVVKYLEGTEFPSDSLEWGGVFICSEDDAIEHAFAISEPPAHDDWIPNNMPTGHEKTFVRTALRRIKESMENTMSARLSNQQSAGTYLAPVSERMGSILSGGFGDGLNGRSASRKKGRSAAKRSRSGRPSIHNLQASTPAETEDGEVLAWFSFEVHGPPEQKIVLTGNPMVYIDGERIRTAPNGRVPEIRVWADKNEEVLSDESELALTVNEASLIWVGITIPDEVAITFQPEIKP